VRIAVFVSFSRNVLNREMMLLSAVVKIVFSAAWGSAA
jgi:hypothetical protein